MTNFVCPHCGAPGQANATLCARCGATLAEPTSTTLHMRIDPAMLRRRHPYATSTASLGPTQAILLQIRGIGERLVLDEPGGVILGRIELNQSAEGYLDLTRFGALERGVSHAHARLDYREGSLTITDLASINGTRLNEQKLVPNQPTEVHDGDEILLGQLSIKVGFENLPRPTPPDAASDTLILPRPGNLQAKPVAGSDPVDARTDHPDEPNSA